MAPHSASVARTPAAAPAAAAKVPAAKTPAAKAPAAKAPARTAAPEVAPTARHLAAVPLSGNTYTVQSGDTLSTIAAKLGVPGGWHKLADANTTTISNPDLVFPGQVLQLPA